MNLHSSKHRSGGVLYEWPGLGRKSSSMSRMRVRSTSADLRFYFLRRFFKAIGIVTLLFTMQLLRLSRRASFGYYPDLGKVTYP